MSPRPRMSTYSPLVVVRIWPSATNAAWRASKSISPIPPAAPAPKIGIAAFGDAAIDDDAPPPPPRDLVIPLTKNPWKREDPGTPPRDNNDDLDEAAAAAVYGGPVGQVRRPASAAKPLTARRRVGGPRGLSRLPVAASGEAGGVHSHYVARH